MAKANIPVEFSPIDVRKVEAAIARIQSQAKGVNFGRGAESINKLSRPLGRITGQASEFQKSLEASNARVLAFGASVAVINKFNKLNTKCGTFVAEMTAFFERFDKDKYGTEGAPLHDPCVIAYLLNPEIFSGRRINVEIETDSELTLGMTVADWWGVTNKEPNALFIGNLNSEKFFEMLTSRISKLP